MARAPRPTAPTALRLSLSVGILLFFAIAAEHLVGWRSLAYPWLFLEDPLELGVAAASIGLTYVIRALRVYRYFRLPAGFPSCLRLMLHHTMLVNVLPLHAGELAFPALMKRHFGMPLERSLPALLWLRAMDMHALVAVPLLLAAATVAPNAATPAAIWLALPLAALWRTGKRPVPTREGASRARRAVASLLAAVPATPAALLENFALTLLNWALKLAVFAWIIQIFSAERYAAAIAGAVGGELSAVLPIQGFANIGTYEAGVVAAMRSFAVPVSDALAGAVNLHLLFLGVSIGGALLAFLIPLTESRYSCV